MQLIRVENAVNMLKNVQKDADLGRFGYLKATSPTIFPDVASAMSSSK